ncbi:MAG TPA: hypothetical protein VKR29_07130 [Candidatus Binataceae bacterium]|nr:hypothetical protein [Candidatus Binataceae bacterium]
MVWPVSHHLYYETAIRRTFFLFVFFIFVLALTSRAGSQPAPPPDLIQLEREVSLKMAHARDEGYPDEPRRKTLADAEKVDAEAEKALKDGEFERAENDLLQVKVLLHNLGI